MESVYNLLTHLERFLPAMHGSIQLPIHRQIGSTVGKPSGKYLINVHAQSWPVAWMHHPICEGISVRKYLFGLLAMPHVFLDPEIVHAQVKMKSRRHAHRTEVGCTVRCGSHVVYLCQAGNLSQV